MSKQAEPCHTNRLVEETSPYLLQHAHNPVDWYPWGPEALEKARREEKPILLSIGYSACHWCHVMERESFEDAEVAKLMNENFVCIKVDREERPDLDDIYMAATLSMSGQGGWPMNVFLTPEHKPFFAGTYFPPQDSQGRPGWSTVLQHMTQLWKDQRQDLVAQAELIVQRLRRQSEGMGKVMGLEPELLDMGVSELAQRFEPRFGGFGKAPKFPPTTAMSLLMRYYSRSNDARLLGMVTQTLNAMALGGIYDQIGGGFSRYSTDDQWLVPHFEKMLYDNALLTRSYLEAYQATQNPLYRRVATQTLDYILKEMTSPEGGFYSATDADSEGEEGKFFVWTPAEIETILGVDKGRHFCAYYDITAGGNWEGKSIPHIPRPLGLVASEFAMSAEDLEKELEQSRLLVYEARSKRVPPGLDDKILTAWNGMMIGAMAEAYRVLREPRYLAAAERAAAFLQEKLSKETRLLRTYRNGKAHLMGYLEDYAFLAEGLLDLYEAGGDEKHLRRAAELVSHIQQWFGDGGGAFSDTASDHEDLIVRHRAGSDGAVPSANAVAASVIVRLSYHMEQPHWRDRALDALAAFGKEVRQMPSGFCRSLSVVDFAVAGPVQITYATRESDNDHAPLLEALSKRLLPNRVIAWRTPQSSAELPLLQGKEVPETPTLHLCQSEMCAAPVTSPEDITKALETLKGFQRFELHRRVDGQATPEGTAALAARKGSAGTLGYRTLGKTGLQVSALGFGCYRVDDETIAHEEAIMAALEAGVNVIDTSSNYANGASERLVGGIARRLSERRAELVIVTKIGYVQGQNLEIAHVRKQQGKPYQEMVEYQDGCWHCLHPEYLAEQLERSLMRLSVETVDVLLLHNPEYFLLDAKAKGRTDPTAVRHEFYTRVEQAFRFLEEACQDGRIASYGVSSNTMGGADDDMETTSLQRFLEAAEKAGGPDHHFRVIQLPLNLVESQAADGELARAAGADVGVLTNRPLNAFTQKTLVRLADFDFDDEEEIDYDANIEKLAALEEEYRQTFGPFVQGQGSEQLFRFADNLRNFDKHLQNHEHWNQVEGTRIRPSLQEQINALSQAIGATPAAESWFGWRERYQAQFRDVMNDLEELALRKSQDMSDSVRDLIEEHIPKERNDAATTSQLALWIAASTPGVTTVLVGMRTPDYVEDALQVMSWEPLPEAAAAYRAVKGFSPGEGVA